MRVLEFLAGAFALFVVAGGVVAGFYMRRLRQPIMLSAQSQFKPPLRWRWSLSQPAMYHRRLVVALRTAQATADYASIGAAGVANETGPRRGLGGKRRETSWDGILGELEMVAVGIDNRLLALEREPREIRRRMIPAFEGEVVEVERAAAGASEVFRLWQRSMPGTTISGLSDRLSSLTAALGDIKSIEEPLAGAALAGGAGGRDGAQEEPPGDGRGSAVLGGPDDHDPASYEAGKEGKEAS